MILVGDFSLRTKKTVLPNTPTHSLRLALLVLETGTHSFVGQIIMSTPDIMVITMV